MLDKIKTPPGNQTSGPPVKLSTDKADHIAAIVARREEQRSKTIPVPAQEEKAVTAPAVTPDKPKPATKKRQYRNRQPLDHLFPHETLAALYQKHIIEEHRSLTWLAKNNGIQSISISALLRHLDKHGIRDPKPAAKQRQPKPTKPIPAAAAAATAIPQPRAKPNTDQLQAVQQLLSTLQSTNITVTGRAVIDLHIEIEMGDQ